MRRSFLGSPGMGSNSALRHEAFRLVNDKIELSLLQKLQTHKKQPLLSLISLGCFYIMYDQSNVLFAQARVSHPIPSLPSYYVSSSGW